MKIERREQDGVTIIALGGVIKLGESSRLFSNYLEGILEEGVTSLLLDMSEIDYVDSTGLGELVGYLQRFSDQGDWMRFSGFTRMKPKASGRWLPFEAHGGVVWAPGVLLDPECLRGGRYAQTTAGSGWMRRDAGWRFWRKSRQRSRGCPVVKFEEHLPEVSLMLPEQIGEERGD